MVKQSFLIILQLYIHQNQILMGGCINPQQQQILCRKCGRSFPRSVMQTHNCLQEHTGKKQTNPKVYQSQPNVKKPENKAVIQKKEPIKNPFLPFLVPQFPPNPKPLQPIFYRNQAKQIPNQTIDIKYPVNPERTLYKWKKQKTISYPLYIKTFKPELLRFRTFQQKMLWFRLNIESLRISWQQGCEVLKVDRSNLVMSSKMGLAKINLRKQLKIQFDDEVVDDAGGLLRQWMHMFIKQIFSPEISIFHQCVTEETAYKFVWDSQLDQQFALEYISILGIIIGKALFDRISLNCYLNRTILRQISQQTVLIHDVFSYDKDLYKSWKGIIQTPQPQNLFLNFTYTKIHGNGTSQVIQLIKDGSNIEVNQGNKYQYIFQLIQLHCNRSISKYLKALCDGIFKVVPAPFLMIFQPHQIQMILNGPQIIDVKDWRQNTIYKGYKPTDQIVLWFWGRVQKLDQQKLSNLLHYCTGSTRVPILGFKYLESNRNTINKFTIQKVPLNKDNPYPKSYTCFNRLQLPEYSTIQQLQNKLDTVIDQEINHFGLG